MLQRDYGTSIRVDRVCRLMHKLQFPGISTEEPYHNCHHKGIGDCTKHFYQELNQNSPNIAWVSDFTYIEIAGKWYYLCIVMDLFSLKVISWHISSKPDADLVMNSFKKVYDKKEQHVGLMFHSDRGSQYTTFHLGNY